MGGGKRLLWCLRDALLGKALLRSRRIRLLRGRKLLLTGRRILGETRLREAALGLRWLRVTRLLGGTRLTLRRLGEPLCLRKTRLPLRLREAALRLWEALLWIRRLAALRIALLREAGLCLGSLWEAWGLRGLRIPWLLREALLRCL